MQRDSISVDEVYHVVGDADDELVRDDGRVEFWRVLEDSRQICVVVDEEAWTVVTVFWNKRGSRRRWR